MLEEFHAQLSKELDESSMALVFGSQRLTTAEIFDDFIPGTVIGTGKRNRKFRVDGYQITDADNSVHLAICDQDEQHTGSRPRAARHHHWLRFQT